MYMIKKKYVYYQMHSVKFFPRKLLLFFPSALSGIQNIMFLSYFRHVCEGDLI